MIGTMRQIALDYLYNKLGGTGDSETWYQNLRNNEMKKLLPYLIEAPRDSMAKHYYVIVPDPNDRYTAILEQREMKKEDTLRLPFVQSTGAQSPALGPIIKRGFQKDKGGGPSAKILHTTLKKFETLASDQQPWSPYFDYVHQLLSRPNLIYSGIKYEGDEAKTALIQAIELIPETKTAFLSILDQSQKLPGERAEYLAYFQDISATAKYSTQKNLPVPNGVDSLTGEKSTIYPNSLSGSGINFTNMDRIGAFANLDENNAWKKFSLSAANADLLYTFSFHLRPKFISRIAGEQALVLPQLSLEQNQRQKFVNQFEDYLQQLKKTVNASTQEKRLLRQFKDHPDVIVNITIIWANFGQKFENVTGVITDVLPSRLSAISGTIKQVKAEESLVFPKIVVTSAEPDLSFNSLSRLFYRLGGKKVKKANRSARLFELKRDIAARVYHKQALHLDRFWSEAMETAKAYLMDMAKTGNFYGLLHEGMSKTGKRYLTLAGWVKHLTQYIYFLREMEVYPPMSDWNYVPKREELNSFFTATQTTAGLDNPDKVYAFLLGVLFGKVMEVQGARGVNVGANALTWLKRLNLTGADLPELYIKVREKLLAYNTEKSKKVRVVVEELGHLGTQIGRPNLSKVDAGYYLLLGQSLTKTLIPKKENEQ